MSVPKVTDNFPRNVYMAFHLDKCQAPPLSCSRVDERGREAARPMSLEGVLGRREDLLPSHRDEGVRLDDPQGAQGAQGQARRLESAQQR